MPYMIVHHTDPDEYCVYKHDREGKPVGEAFGCHPTREKAERQMAALYVHADGKEAPNKMLQFGAPIQVEEIKSSGDDWEVSGYASTFGNIDLGNDVVLPGAFARTLADGHRVKFLHSHDPRAVLGVPKELREDKHGLFGQFKISKTQLGADTRQLLADGAMDSFSIGYVAQDFDIDRKSGVRQLKDVDLPEISLVALGMNPQALVTGMKAWADLLAGQSGAGWTLAERTAMVQADIQDIADNLRSLTDQGRELTDTKRAELTDLLATFASLDAVRSDLQRILAAPTPGTQSLALRLALTRRKLAAQGILED